ncbi:MAG TPA: protoporphyrinogen oxidase [Nitrospirales bacterium]|nr:protoporphyrinogen oxidase [Nitrospirales bacterium]
MPPVSRTVLIVGGGIAGLSAAYGLAESAASRDSPTQCTLVEAEPRLGGKILTEQVGGFVIEGGPDSFLAQKPWGIELCRRLGLADRVLGTNQDRRKTYVYSRGCLEELPEGLALGVPRRLVPFLRSGLLSWKGKLRLGAELLIPRRSARGDESLGAFFRRRLGDEALERIIEPLMTGIYAGDADSLSIQATFPRFPEMERQAGSIVRALLGSWRWHQGEKPGGSAFVTLQGGLSEMVQALTTRLGKLRVLAGRRVRAVRISGTPGGYEVTIEGEAPLAVGALILATSAYDAAILLEPLDGELAALLRGIPYASTATISLGFRRQDFSHRLDGYGFVIPRIEGRALLAVTWTSSKWSHRAPDDAVLLRAYVGGAGRETVLGLSDEGLVSLVRSELRDMMGITEAPVLAKVYRWPRSMPQYLVGHLERLAAVDERLARWPGLFLTGAGYRGVGIPDCIRDGLDAAEHVRAYFDKGASRVVQ